MDRPLAGIVEPPAAVTPAAAPRVIVSNHGGSQLDGGMAMLDALPAVARAVGNRVTVLMDGGVRRGAHMVKAFAMGAKAVLVGRGAGARDPARRARPHHAAVRRAHGGEIGPDLIARDAEDR